MSSRKDISCASSRRDPFALLRQMTSDVDRMFDEVSRKVEIQESAKAVKPAA